MNAPLGPFYTFLAASDKVRRPDHYLSGLVHNVRGRCVSFHTMKVAEAVHGIRRLDDFLGISEHGASGALGISSTGPASGLWRVLTLC